MSENNGARNPKLAGPGGYRKIQRVLDEIHGSGRVPYFEIFWDTHIAIGCKQLQKTQSSASMPDGGSGGRFAMGIFSPASILSTACS